MAIDVDPRAEGELFADTEAHVRSQARAAGEVRCLVEKEVEDIALETSVPRASGRHAGGSLLLHRA